MIRGIAHVCIRAVDLDATRRFYCDGLGLGKAFDFLRDGKVVGFYLKVGNGTFLEFFRAEPEAASAFPIAHFCLEVDSIDEVRRRLAAAGYACSEKSPGADHAYQAWTADPDGTRIELHEYRPGCCQLTGCDCVLD